MAIEPYRVLVAGKVHDAGIALLRQRPDVVVDMVDAVTTEAYRPFLHNCDGILIRTQPMTACARVTRRPHGSVPFAIFVVLVGLVALAVASWISR